MSKLVVFDVDGTILDSQSLYDRTVLEYSRLQGLPEPSLEKIRHGYGNPHAHDFGWGVSKDEQYKHMIATMDLTDKYSMSGEPQHTPDLFDGAKEALIHLKKMGHTLAIITGKPEAPLLHLLEMHNVRELFSAHRTHDDIKRRGEREKPAPDMLHSVMKELKFAPKDAIMIGDTTMDIRMGLAAGVHTIGVTWGAHPKEHLADAGAHHIVDTEFDDVMDIIAEIFNPI